MKNKKIPSNRKIKRLQPLIDKVILTLFFEVGGNKDVKLLVSHDITDGYNDFPKGVIIKKGTEHDIVKYKAEQLLLWFYNNNFTKYTPKLINKVRSTYNIENILNKIDVENKLDGYFESITEED